MKSSDSDTNDILQELQRKKLEEEIKKIRAERLRAEFEKSEARRTAKRKWYQKTSSLQVIAIVLGSVTILGFYFNYVIKPVAELKSTQVSLENAKKEKELYEKGLMLDSLQKSTDTKEHELGLAKFELARQKASLNKFIDSLNNLQDHRTRLLDEKQNLIDRHNKLSNKYIASQSKIANNKQLKFQLTTINEQLKERLRDLEDSLQSVNQVIDSSKTQSNLFQSLITDAPNPENIDVYRDIIIQKFNELSDYFAILSDPKTTEKEAKKIIDFVLDIFFDDGAIVNVSTISSNNLAQYPIKDYLYRLRKRSDNKIISLSSITVSSILPSTFEKESFGNYMRHNKNHSKI